MAFKREVLSKALPFPTDIPMHDIWIGNVAAFCGPIGFIGLAVPHITRFLLHRSDHRLLLPATALAGALILLCCDAVSSVFCLPLNALTSLLGIPVVVWIVFKK